MPTLIGGFGKMPIAEGFRKESLITLLFVEKLLF